MKKLKIVLKSNYIYYFVFLFTICYVFINIKFVPFKYENLNNNLKGYVNDYYIDGDKLTIIIKNKNKIILNYYFKTEKEKNNFEICYGDYIEVIGKSIEIKENTNFNLFNYKRYLKTKKIYYSFSVDKIKRLKKNTNLLYHIKNKIVTKIESNISSNYIKTFILGDKRDINSNMIESYQRLGVSHLFAISGMHVSFLSMILLKILSKINDKAKHSIVILFLLFYTFLTNYTISIVRSTMQFILFKVNKLFDLKIKNVNIMLIIISAVLLYNPYYIYDISFLFSFSISFSLILFRKNIDIDNNYFIKSFITSLISFLVSLPILINNFYEINFLSILYNIFYIPFVSFILFPINILTLIFSFLDPLNNYIINIFESITRILSKMKFLTFSSAKLPIFLIVIYYICLYFAVTKKGKKYILFLVLLIVFFINNNRITIFPVITYLDVGQGDSCLIRVFNKNVLIDTGGKTYNKKEKWRQRKKEYNIADNITIPYLKSVGVKKIDYLILTHGDFDHMGEASNLTKKFNVKKVIFNNDSYNELETSFIKILKKKKIKYYHNVEKIKLQKSVLYFLNTKIYDNENDNSNVVYTEINNYKFLFMGDAGITTYQRLKEVLPCNITVLKVGHHGALGVVNEDMLKILQPKFALISVGQNKFGHPATYTLKVLKGTKILRTDINNCVKFVVGKNTLKVYSFNIRKKRFVKIY